MSEEERTFGAPWSALVWAITLVFCIAVLPAVVVGVVTICMRERASGAGEGLLFLVAGVPTAAVVLCVLLAPLRYEVAASTVRVKRLGPDVLIPIDSIQEVRRIVKRDLGIGIRVFGSGGFLGGFGVFLSSRLGLLYGYVTDASRLILIECTDGKRYLLSPETPEEFVVAVRACLLRANGAEPPG